MQKIMFNDNLCLTEAVLVRLKTHTRRGIPELKDIDSERIKTVKVEKVENDGSIIYAVHLTDGGRILVTPKFKIGEVVAIAQSYKDIAPYKGHNGYSNHRDLAAGWNNKMFVKAYRMPHHIRITDIRVERLQDISVEDCYAEGISYHGTRTDGLNFTFDNSNFFATAKDAYQALINKLDKKMWKRNPWVFVYVFELVV